ncbi:MAG: chorismate synthase [Tissierellia bacterium]|nr:chorismate synthase [Tissierellia bacterium]
MLKILTAGESHGKSLLGIIDGFPQGIYLDEDYINNELMRRQKGYGRSSRMEIERDQINILSGIHKGYTTGNPISIMINNKGTNIDLVEITKPRPGHGDLAGTLKYNHKGARNILERASARETAMRVALGGLCKLFLKEFNIEICSHIIQIGNIKSKTNYYNNLKIEDLKAVDKSPLRVLDREKEKLMIKEIEKAKSMGDTLGGVMEVIGTGIPIGLGSHAHWDRKLDGKIAQGILSIPGIKGIEIGLGFSGANKLGSKYHDEIHYSNTFYRKTNNAGGIEGGISNGEAIVFRAIMKPIPTLRKPLKTVDLESKENTVAQFERSDVCAVPSASIVAESVLAYILMKEFLIKFGGDSMEEIKANYKNYINILENR